MCGVAQNRQRVEVARQWRYDEMTEKTKRASEWMRECIILVVFNEFISNGMQLITYRYTLSIARLCVLYWAPHVISVSRVLCVFASVCIPFKSIFISFHFFWFDDSSPLSLSGPSAVVSVIVRSTYTFAQAHTSRSGRRKTYLVANYLFSVCDEHRWTLTSSFEYSTRIHYNNKIRRVYFYYVIDTAVVDWLNGHQVIECLIPIRRCLFTIWCNKWNQLILTV